MLRRVNLTIWRKEELCNAIEADVTGRVKKVIRIAKGRESYCRPLKVSMIDTGAKKIIESKAKTCGVMHL